MKVVLKGSSPAAMAAGILLLSRGHSFGTRVTVEILGDPGDIGVVRGPALLYSAPLASCGVGRDLGNGATVIVPGPVTEPLAVSLSPNGTGDWFYADRSGSGIHPATQALVALRRDPRIRARWLYQQVIRGVEELGATMEPALFDVLFGAPVPPLTRLAVTLRAGRAMTGERGAPLTGFLTGEMDLEAEVPTVKDALARLVPPLQEAVNACMRTAELLGAEDGGRTTPLAEGLSEILAHLSLLPTRGILPPLSPADDAVAFSLERAIKPNHGDPHAEKGLLETYRFLGGKFVSSAHHPVELPSDPPPADRLGRWKWFCTHVSDAAIGVERIWRDLVDPPM